MPDTGTTGRLKNDIPSCCGARWFAGDTKILKVTVPELEDLSEFDVRFVIETRYGWNLIKTRDSGVTTALNVISIRFETGDTEDRQGTYEYRIRLTSPANEVSTVSYGNLTLS